MPEEAEEAVVRAGITNPGRHIHEILKAAAPFIAARAVEGLNAKLAEAEERADLNFQAVQQERERLVQRETIDALCKRLALKPDDQEGAEEVAHIVAELVAALDQEGDGA